MRVQPVDLSEFEDRELTPDLLHAATAKIMAAITALARRHPRRDGPAERFDPRTAGVAVIGNPNDPRNKAKRRRRESPTTFQNQPTMKTR